MQQQPSVFNQPYNPAAQPAAMTSQAPNMPGSHSWVNPNPVLSMDTVTISPSATMSNLPHPGRQQPPSRGSESGYPHRMERDNFDGSILPQLSIRDLQILDATTQGADGSQSQQLFHMLNQREVLPPETYPPQTHPGSSNHALQTVWPNFNLLNPLHNSFNESVSEGKAGSQGLGVVSCLFGTSGDEFMNDPREGGSQPGFQLKQEPQITVGQEARAPVMQTTMENHRNTYTNLLPHPTRNGTHVDSRQDGSQPLKNLQSPYSNSSVASDTHFPTLADWIKANRHSN